MTQHAFPARRPRVIGADDLARLLRQAGAGELRARTGVYDATSARAYGLCRRLLDDPDVAEDAAELGYREVWRLAASYDQKRGSATAFVLSTVHRVAVGRAHETGVVRGSPAATRPAVAVDAVLAQLGTVEWAAVELAYFGGHRHGAVAGALGLAPAVALTRIRDGLTRVRDLTAAG